MGSREHWLEEEWLNMIKKRDGKKSNRSGVIIGNHRQRQSLHASNYLRALLGTAVGGLVGLGDGGGVVLHDPYNCFVSVEVNWPPEARLTPPYSTV